MGGLFGGGGGGSQTINELKLPPFTAEVAFEYLRSAAELADKTYATYTGWAYHNANGLGIDPTGGLTYATRNPFVYLNNIVGNTPSKGDAIQVASGRPWATIEAVSDRSKQEGFPSICVWLQDSSGQFLPGDNVIIGDTTATVYYVQNSNEIEGIERLSNRARHGVIVQDMSGRLISDDFVGDGKTLLETIMRGDRVLANIYTDDFYDKQIDELLQEYDEVIIPTIDQDALLGGYDGGSGHAAMLYQAAVKAAEAIRNLLYKVYYEEFQTSVKEIIETFHHAVPLGQESLRDAELLRQAGLYDREYRQSMLTDKYKAFREIEDINVNKINILGNAIKTLVGAQVSQTSPLYRPVPFTQAAGVAMAGTALAMALYKNTSLSPYTGDRIRPEQYQDTGMLGNQALYNQVQGLGVTGFSDTISAGRQIGFSNLPQIEGVF